MRPALAARAALAIAAVFCAVGPEPAQAHLGSADVFHDGSAGPYRLFVAIRPPEVIPGTAQVEVRVEGDATQVTIVTIVPLPLAGPGSTAAPTPDVAARAPGDPSLYAGRLWLMESGSWQVRIHVEGPAGAGELAVPVPAIALRTRTMDSGLGAILLGLLIFLFAGLVSIVGASVRDADLRRDEHPDPRRRRRGRIAQIVTAVFLGGIVTAGAAWWDTEARIYKRWVYKPLGLEAAVDAPPAATTGGATLTLTLTEPGWLRSRRLDDLLPDHGHLMHLFAVRVPDLDVVAHLHPQQQAPGRFTKGLPGLPAGDYQLFADIVHRTGLAETATTIVALSATPPVAPTGDDSVGAGPPLPSADRRRTTAALPDGTRVVWLRDPGPIVAGRPTRFRFRVDDAAGRPVTDLAPYMGMAGHAMFIKHDRTVFAHVHPSGSVPMAALMLVAPTAASAGVDPHAGHAGHQMALPPEVAFPFACPQAGGYRLIVQVKRAATIETATFDLDVAPAPG